MKRSKFQQYIKISSGAMFVALQTAYPSISFNFAIDNDNWLDLKIEKIVANIYMANGYMGNKVFERIEQQQGEVSTAFDRPPTDSINDIKERGESRNTVLFSCPRDAFQSQAASQWAVTGTIIFSCRLGIIPMRLSLAYALNDNELKNIRESLYQRPP